MIFLPAVWIMQHQFNRVKLYSLASVVCPNWLYMI